MSSKDGHFYHNNLPFVVRNEGSIYDMEWLPMPPQEGFPLPINTYDDVDEPRYDPDIHLRLSDPEFVVRLDNWKKVKSIPPVKDDNSGTTDSKLGFTAPFGLVSEEGVKVMLKILRRELDLGRECTMTRGNKRAIRGFWYTSPFMRDMMSCPKHLAHLEKLTGESMAPYFSYSNTPQINVSKRGNSKTIDHWHYDGVKYVSVVMLSDMTNVTGGALEVLKRDKFEGLHHLNNGYEFSESDTYSVSYDKPGMSILNNGSEVLHHVTPITHNPDNIERVSVIMAFGSRNAFRPDKLCLHTMYFCDNHTGLYGYEFFRYKAWHMMSVLKAYAEGEPFVSGGDADLAEKLREVAEELSRAAAMIENPALDRIKFYHEENKECTTRHPEKDADSTLNINSNNSNLFGNISFTRELERLDHPDMEEHYGLR